MRAMKAEVYQKLLDMVSLQPPMGVVERQREQLEAQLRREGERSGIDDKTIQAEIDKRRETTTSDAVRQVKLYFILRKIAELEDIEADEIELEKRLEALARDSKRPIDEVRNVFGDDLRESMREQQTLDFLIAHAQFDEKA
jgi:FKBP-type peptidyl-prolyl cis-trans isomerase (trigger factor)